METKLEQIAAKAVKQRPKSVVREIRTPRSVGTGGGRPPPVTRCHHMDEPTVIARIADEVERKLGGESSGHDWWHIHRVWKMAEHIANNTSANPLVVQLAALLHDIADWIPAALILAFMNSGQACAAGTRFLVPKSRLDAVKQAIREAMRTFTVGDPADPRIAVGPMVSQKHYDRVQSYIRKGIEEGAELLVGGEGHPQGLDAGYFVKPTVFVNVTNDMTIAREEIFGPVLSVIAYDSEDEAIALANDSRY